MYIREPASLLHKYIELVMYTEDKGTHAHAKTWWALSLIHGMNQLEKV